MHMSGISTFQNFHSWCVYWVLALFIAVEKLNYNCVVVQQLALLSKSWQPNTTILFSFGSWSEAELRALDEGCEGAHKIWGAKKQNILKYKIILNKYNFEISRYASLFRHCVKFTR